eukprot:5525411-Ditylum_brightwellii.AAC.1
MGNNNEYIESNNIKQFFTDLGMQELIKERHVQLGPAITKGKRAPEAINGIWGTLGVGIVAGSYLPIYAGG